jgi:diguanylate cyclase (GGDEF)-like protein
VGRIGGEEFLCVLESCDAGTALAVAERCRSAVCAAPVPVGGATSQETRISISVGMVVAAGSIDLPVEELLRRADEALYRSKQDGRNRVTVTGAERTRQETA